MDYKKLLIAVKEPKGDKWKLIKEKPQLEEIVNIPEGGYILEDKIHGSLMDTLEAYCRLKKYKGDFLLSPSEGKIYIINPNEEVIIVKEEKKYSIYGDLSEK